MTLLTIISISILLFTAYAFHLAIGDPPKVVPKEEQTEGADLHPYFISVFRFGINFIK
jgi:hypothetical protein